MGAGVRVTFRSRNGDIQGEHIAHVLPVRIGRAPSEDCRIAHPLVSQSHAMIELVGTDVCIRDLHSRNGTQNQRGEPLTPGEPVPLARLGNGFTLACLVEVSVTPLHIDAADAGPPLRIDGSQFDERLALNHASAGGAPGGLSPLPALSMAEPPPGYPIPRAPGRRSTPAPERPAAAPHGPSGYGVVDSLPGLAPVAGQFAPGANAMGAGAKLSNPSVSPAGASRNTGHLTMSIEMLALLGLRELGASLVPSVPLETTGDVARFLTKLHDLVEAFCRSFVLLREGYSKSVSLTELRRAEPRRKAKSESAERVAKVRDPAALAVALLDWRNQEFDAAETVRETLVDIAAHDAALTDAVLHGVKAVLDELAPEAIESASGGPSIGGMLGRHRALWEHYKTTYDELVEKVRRGR